MAHQNLMQDIPRELESAGEYRRYQNWLDGSNYSPLVAIVVPPPPENVANREVHFKDLDKYREGQIESLLTRFVSAANIASVEARRAARTFQRDGLISTP